MQELHHVENVDQRVGKFDEGRDDPLFALHAVTPVPTSTPPGCRGPKGYQTYSIMRTRPESTSLATSRSARPSANACERRRTNPSSSGTPSCTETMPVAWCISAQWLRSPGGGSRS